ncbi:hypothetical protein GGTG_13418 [Gaeumannomyces tritici R3-111a-1]|uniref:Uncharacterized protein n=1 Tax=Gaeumannomyces tritici (strain R3-111a-1) TaxID=644352 RepID=J3PIT8_GAET3|nr:hypothetical protein GGTG_13418 [Gaeumannomyces tritici R3-111a-1]EJT69021.1 hypothetical protein GGTG_13418 [Gaeumannomyces tritici R3-111a-1]
MSRYRWTWTRSSGLGGKLEAGGVPARGNEGATVRNIRGFPGQPLLVIELGDDCRRAFNIHPHLFPLQNLWLYQNWQTLRGSKARLDDLQPTPMTAEDHDSLNNHFYCCLQRFVDEAARNRVGSSQDIHRAADASDLRKPRSVASPVSSSTSSRTLVRKASAVTNTPSPPSPSPTRSSLPVGHSGPLAAQDSRSREPGVKRPRPRGDTSQDVDHACKRARATGRARRSKTPSSDALSPKGVIGGAGQGAPDQGKRQKQGIFILSQRALPVWAPKSVHSRPPWPGKIVQKRRGQTNVSHRQGPRFQP